MIFVYVGKLRWCEDFGDENLAWQSHELIEITSHKIQPLFRRLARILDFTPPSHSSAAPEPWTRVTTRKALTAGDLEGACSAGCSNDFRISLSSKRTLRY